MRKLLVSIKKRVDRLLLPRYRVVCRYGNRFLVDNQNWIDARIIVRAPYENEQLAICCALIREHDIDTLVDVGSNFGLYAVVLNSAEASLLRTYAFEPVTRNYLQLCGNLYLNELAGRVTPLRKALSDRNGRAVIHLDPGSTGVSRLSLADSGRDNAVFTQQEQIETVRFDDELSISGQRLFIKIDVEGHELEVLKGMAKTLSDNMACLQVEVFGKERVEALDAFFKSLGYRFDGATGSDRRYTNFSSK